MTTREKYKLRLKKKLFLTYIRTMRTKKNLNINRVHAHLNIRYFCRIMYIMYSLMLWWGVRVEFVGLL